MKVAAIYPDGRSLIEATVFESDTVDIGICTFQEESWLGSTTVLTASSVPSLSPTPSLVNPSHSAARGMGASATEVLCS